MLDILPALLWIIAAVIAVNICSITAIRGNLFSKKHRDVHPVRWSIMRCISPHWSLARCHIRYMRCSVGFLGEVPAFLRTCRMAVAAVMAMLIAAELVFMYLQPETACTARWSGSSIRPSNRNLT